jgi:hypothetical protein
MYSITLEGLRATIFAREKQQELFSESVSLALVTQHTMRMRLIALCSVACLALPRFSKLSHKRNDFRIKIFKNKICFGFL